MRTKILTAAILALSAAGVQAAEKPLKKLLVNDDGCQSVGTTSRQEKLAAKGYSQVQSWKDLAGIERVSGGQLPD